MRLASLSAAALLAFAGVSFAPIQAVAQTAQPLTDCNVVATLYTANGLPMPLTMTPGGQLCVKGTFSAAAPPGTFTPAQVSVGATATLIAASRASRALLTVVNTTTTAIYLGGSGVTTSTGQLLPGVVGASLTVPGTFALYGIVATGTATVTEAEVY